MNNAFANVDIIAAGMKFVRNKWSQLNNYIENWSYEYTLLICFVVLILCGCMLCCTCVFTCIKQKATKRQRVRINELEGEVASLNEAAIVLLDQENQNVNNEKKQKNNKRFLTANSQPKAGEKQSLTPNHFSKLVKVYSYSLKHGDVAIRVNSEHNLNQFLDRNNNKDHYYPNENYSYNHNNARSSSDDTQKTHKKSSSMFTFSLLKRKSSFDRGRVRSISNTTDGGTTTNVSYKSRIRIPKRILSRPKVWRQTARSISNKKNENENEEYGEEKMELKQNEQKNNQWSDVEMIQAQVHVEPGASSFLDDNDNDDDDDEHKCCVRTYRAFLVASSDVFNALMAHDIKEKKANGLEIYLEYCNDVSVCHDLIYFLITNRMRYDADVFMLLQMAHIYQIDSLLDRCIDKLVDNITVDRFVGVVRLFDLYQITKKYSSLVQFAKKHKDDIKICPDFAELPHAFRMSNFCD